MLSPNSLEAVKCLTINVLDILVVNCREKYLGLPAITGKNKKGLFGQIKDRV